ncbi:MAG: hypothetical protein WC003_07545 [Terrimicrobiaceae bacterium]
MPKVSFELADARAVGSRLVRLHFADGGELDLDLTPDLEALSGPLVDDLKNPEVFARLEIRHGSLVFPTGLDYGADVLRLWCENGGVANQEKTDELAARCFSSTPR